jgi:putative PIN family toxin of toxin-antitoxin system
MRVVLDTNVFVSSFYESHPRHIINAWATSKVQLCLTRPIVREYTDVLERLGLAEELSELLAVFARGHSCLFTSKTPDLSIVENDPDDDKFIECAVALQASHIVSGDKHLLQIEEYMGIKIVAPKAFVELLNADNKR